MAKGGDYPSDEVLRGCEGFICYIFCQCGVHIWGAKMLGWFLFKQLRDEQGVDKLPPIDQPMEHGLNIYAVPMSRLTYGTRINPTCLDPLTLGWRYLYQNLVLVLSQVAPAPVSVLQLVRCNCQKSKCSRR